MYPQESPSPLRVQISNNFTVGGIAVRISLHNGYENIRIGRIGDNGHLLFNPYDIGDPVDPGVTFSFNDEIGQALLDALLRYYQGASDMHTVRSDYLHERKRVDDLIIMYGNLAMTVVEGEQ